MKSAEIKRIEEEFIECPYCQAYNDDIGNCDTDRRWNEKGNFVCGHCGKTIRIIEGDVP